MASIRQLFVTLSLKADTFNNALRESQKEVKELEKTIKPTMTAIKDMGATAMEAGKALTVGLTAPLASIGALSIKAALDFDASMDDIRAATGATGGALDKLGTDFRTVFAKVPNDIKDVTAAIADLNVRTGLSGKPLQDLAEAELNLARITHTDVNENIRETTRLFENWHISTENQVPALDTLFKVAQSTGVGVSKLAASVTDSGAVLRQFGFSFEQTAALIGQFEKAGVNADGVIKGLGLSLKSFAKAGITDSSEALKEIERQIKAAGTAAEANALALQFFGKSGIQMAAAIREGRLDIVDLDKALTNNHDTVNKAAQDTKSFADKLDQLGHTAKLALEPIGKEMIDALERLIPKVESALQFVADLTKSFAALPPSVQDVIIVVGVLVAAMGPLLIVFGSLTTSITGLIPLVIKLATYFPGITTALSTLSLGTVAAVSGVVALGAAIGVLVGSLINWAIEGTRVEKWLDGFTTGALKMVGFQWNSTTEAQKSAEFTAKAVAVALANQGKTVDGLAVSTKKLGEQTTATTTIQVKSADQVKKDNEALKKSEEDLKKARDLAQKSLLADLDVREKMQKAELQLLKDFHPIQLQFTQDILDAGKAAIQAAADQTSFSDAVKDAVDAMAQSHYNATQMQKDFDSLTMKDPGVHIAEGFGKATESLGEFNARMAEGAAKLKQATEDIKQSAGKIFDDMFIKGESVFQSLGNLLKGGALSLGRAIFEDVAGALLGPVKKAFDDFFTSLIESAGIKSFVTSLGNKLGSALSGIFGGGGSAASGAISAGTSAAQSAAGSASRVSQGLSSGLTGGLISAAGSILGGVISALGSARQEGTLNAIEYNTRATAIEIADMMDSHLSWILNMVTIVADRIHDELMFPLNSIDSTLHDISAKFDALIDKTGSILTGGGGGETLSMSSALSQTIASNAGPIIGGSPDSPTVAAFQLISADNTIPISIGPYQSLTLASAMGDTIPVDMGPSQSLTLANATAPAWDPRSLFTNALPAYASGTDYVPKTGPAMLHQGEQVIPAGEARSNVTLAPVINNNIELTVNGSSRDVVDYAVQRLRQMIKFNSDSITADIARYVKKTTPGVVNG